MAGSGLLYWRILRLRRIQPRPAITFLLFEGSIMLGGLLAFAGLLTWWGAAAVPIAVAVMVKLNDVVATNLDLRPLAEAQLRVPRPAAGRRMGISPVPAPTTAEPAASPRTEPAVVRGVAAVPPRPRPPVPTLSPQDGTESSPESSPDDPILTEGSDAGSSDAGSNVASDGDSKVASAGGDVVTDGGLAALESAAQRAASEPAATQPAAPEGDAGRRPPNNPGHFGA